MTRAAPDAPTALRPTRGVLAAGAAAVVLHLLSRITGGGWLALASAAALALPVAAVALRPRLAGLRVELGDVRCRVGDVAEQRLVVRNAGTRPSPAARLHDATPGLLPLAVAVPPLPPGGEAAAVLSRTAVARGVAAASAELVSTAPFGLLRARVRVPVAARALVAPAPAAPAGSPAGGTGTGTDSSAVAGSGTEVLGLRPWRPGDSARSVHARSTARHGRPVVLEREREAGPGVVVLCAGAGHGEAWEAAVARSCALAEDALRRDRPPVLVATGHPAPARVDRAAVLDWHAGLDAAQPPAPPAVDAAVRAAGRGGTVLLVGPSPEQVPAVRRACAADGVELVVVGGL